MNQIHNQSSNDDDLLRLLKENDEHVFVLLYKRYWTELTRLAEPFLNDVDSCQEVVQELFVTLYRKRASLHINISISAYLYVSLRNKIRNHIRKRSIYNRHIAVVKRFSSTITNDVEQAVNRNELEREILVCLHAMPEKYRKVYLLYQEGRCPLKKVAKILDRPVDTVEKQFRKAIFLLRQHLSFFKEKGGSLPS